MREAEATSPSTILSSMSWPVPYEVVRYLQAQHIINTWEHFKMTDESSVILKQRFSQVYSLEGVLKQVNIKVCSIKTVFVGPYFIFNTAESAVRRRKKTISDIQQNKSGRLSDVCVKAKNDVLQEVQLC